MNIQISHIPYSYQQYNNKNLSVSPLQNYTDSFVSNSSFANKQVSFGGFFSNLINKLQATPQQSDEDLQVSEFAKQLSKGAKEVMSCGSAVQCNIKPSNFKNIVSPSEFRKILPCLIQENFIFSPENKQLGIYCVDLDYQSNYSSGKENIFTILNKLSTYSDEFYNQTGKDFVFALSDRDSLEGLQHAVKYIGEHPDKFQHLKFVPAIKMSFAHKAPASKLEYENSEMLVYGINPFSKNLIDFVENTTQKRKTMIVNFIKQVNDLYPEFSYRVIEFAKQNGIKYKKDYCVSNLYWRAREYAQTKGSSAMTGRKEVPQAVVDNAQSILDSLDKLYVGSQETTYSVSGSQIIDVDEELNKNITEIFQENATHDDEKAGKVVSPAENLYNDMIDCFTKEQEPPVLALASPYYFSHYFKPGEKQLDDVAEFFIDLKEKSNGMLCAIETVAPFYDLDKVLREDKSLVENFNEYILKKTGLYQVGGSFAKAE